MRNDQGSRAYPHCHLHRLAGVRSGGLAVRVLVGCEFTGTVRRAFAALGHDAWSCDLLPAQDGSANHLRCDVRDVLGRGWELAIFHPPCTYLCSSGLHWNRRGVVVDRKPRQQWTEEALDFVRELLAAPMPRIALENPVGCISTQIRPADQYIQPWQFGHDASKKTGLWLKGLPKLEHTSYYPPRYVCQECGWHGDGSYGECPRCGGLQVRERWGNQTDSGQNRLGPSADRWAERSATYEGIAKAMAGQWGIL